LEFYEKEAAMSSAVDVPELLDCRRLAPDACSDAVLDAFDALAPGRRIRLVFAQAPASALEALRRERRGAFAAQEASRCRVEVDLFDRSGARLAGVQQAHSTHHLHTVAFERNDLLRCHR
jgi:uncharacterized protein (DUF2249 family)